MRILTNRIVILFVLIFWATYFWEFYVKPVTGPLYTAAVSEFKNKNYERSLELLHKSYRIDPNDTAILTLMGWDYLKMGDAKSAEPYFARAHRLAPHVVDAMLGYAYTEIGLKKFEEAAALLRMLRQRGLDNADVHVAWATIYRQIGRNSEGVREFKIALAMQKNNAVALKNLQEIYNVTGDVREVSLEFQPLVRAKELTYPARVEGERFDWQIGGAWKPTYLAGVGVIPSLPGHFPVDSPIDPALYADSLQNISELGANTVRVNTILSTGFYRTLWQFNSTHPGTPLRLLHGISFGDPPRGDFFDRDYYQLCQKQIRDTIDVIHGQADIGATPAYGGGIYPNNVALWVAGFVVGQTWLSHVVTTNNQLHPDMRSYKGTYIEVPSGSPTEIFLAQMIDYAAEYEESKYNWQHPVAFLNWPPLDPMRHPTESTTVEEAIIRRNLGERFPFPGPPYDDDDGISLDPLHLRPRERFPAGYFAAYSVFPSFPDFLNYDPNYQQVRDTQGSNPFLGYLEDLKAHHPGIPLLITEYEIPSSLGIGHLSIAGFDQGGKTEEEQGRLLARFTQNIYEAGAAGGFLFEWFDEWSRQAWPVRKFEVPEDRKPLWANFMDPAEYYGLVTADPHRRSDHRLSGEPSEWAKSPPLYAELSSKLFQSLGDRYDPARILKALYVDADEGFLYLRVVVGKLDNNNDGKPDWDQAHYVIGISTAPGQAGLTTLPYIAPIPFRMGMTYAIHLAGPESSNLWIASSYNPFRIAPVDGIPGQTDLLPKLGWKASITGTGSFEPMWIEPNRRRFGRDGHYFPPGRYDRGILRYGSLNPKAPDYDSLAEWHANVRTNTIDLRIPWNLLNVADPSNLKVITGIRNDGTTETAETSGFLIAVLSYRPLEISRLFPIMEQGHPVADALPGMTGPSTILVAGLKQYRWAKWDNPEFSLRIKDSYPILRKAFLQLPNVR